MARRFHCRRPASSGEQRPGDSATGEDPARFHQLLSAEREPAVRLLFFPELGLGRCRSTGGAQQRPRLSRPSLFPDPRRYHVWPALAQREVPEQPRPRALSDSDQGRRELLEELQGASRSRSKTRSERSKRFFIDPHKETAMLKRIRTLADCGYSRAGFRPLRKRAWRLAASQAGCFRTG